MPPRVTLTGYRNDDARAKGLPEAADPTRHTTVADGESPFQFSFPNLDGQNVSSTDARFDGKVLIVDVSGSWCPNCHDEAPFLQGLYRKYHSRGLGVIAAPATGDYNVRMKQDFTRQIEQLLAERTPPRVAAVATQ